MSVFLMKMSMILGVVFLLTNHPMAMTMTLFLQTILICLITGSLSMSFWYSYILILIFLGGMLVLFIYMTSLVSDEMFLYSMKVTFFIITLMGLFLLVLSLSPKNNLTETLTAYTYMNLPKNESLLKMYNQPTNILTILLASYLLLGLIAIIKIVSIYEGPLRAYSHPYE